MGEPAGVMRATEVVPDGSGDFAALVHEHQKMVFSLALHFLRDPETAEEVAQDVFLQLHRNVDTLKSAEHITFWLRRVTYHRCIDAARRRQSPQVSLDERMDPAAEERPRDPLLARTLAHLLASLPAAARMVVILRYQEDLTPTEIAAVLEMPVATVKSHLQRSLARLREQAARVIGGMPR